MLQYGVKKTLTEVRGREIEGSRTPDPQNHNLML
jgi:hypothetical protein